MVPEDAAAAVIAKKDKPTRAYLLGAPAEDLLLQVASKKTGGGGLGQPQGALRWGRSGQGGAAGYAAERLRAVADGERRDAG